MTLRALVTILAGLALLGCGGSEGDEVVPGSADLADATSVWVEGPRLPAPVANNGVGAVAGPGGVAVVSVLGIDSTKVWSGVTNAAYRWDLGGDDAWREIDPVPGPGRLAPTVEALAGRIFVFGGYTVAEDGSEVSTPLVNVYAPHLDSWGLAAEIPTPVDDAVSGVYAHSTIYLVSGWHDSGNVPLVQVFDPTLNLWSTASEITGSPVFGHSGGIAGDAIVYVGGARVVSGRPRFVADTAAWLGRIDGTDPSVVSWEPIAPPPAGQLYRSAAGVADGRVVLVGGTNNPYNYDGIGYDGVRSEPIGSAVAYDPARGWLELEPPPVATMDHRNLAVAGGYAFLVGGMLPDGSVSDRVFYASVEALLDAADSGR